jgi:VWFA-related protein
MMNARVVAAVLALVCTAGTAAAQGRPPLVSIDVVVSDGRGRPVATLAPGDFEVLVAGEPRTPADVRYVAVDPHLPLAGEAFAPIASRADELREAAREGTRLFGIFLDEYHVAPAATTLVRDSLTQFVREQLGPRDLFVLVKPLDSLVQLRLGRDREAALRAIEAFQGRKGELAPRDAFERSVFAGDPARIVATRAQVAASAISALANHLGPLGPARKTMLVVSEGFTPTPRRRGDGPLPTLDSAIAAANRAKASIYPVVPPAPPAAPTPVATEPGATGAATVDPARETLDRLADETNGAVVPLGVAAAAGFERIAHDSAGFYLVSLDAGADGRFHSVDVRVRRPGLRVRGRRGFWAPSAEELARIEAASRPRPSGPPPLPRRSSPLIRPWFGQAPAANGQTRISFVWEPAAAAAVRARGPLPSRIQFKAMDGEGTIVHQATVAPSASGAADEEARGAAFVAAPGRLRVEMVIEDSQGRPLDTDVRELAVAPFSAPVALGTASVWRARTAREFNAIAANPLAPPTPSRDFSRSERLLVRVPVAGAAAPLAPHVRARLVSRAGAPLRDLAVTAKAPDAFEIDTTLSWLAAGEYTIEVVADAGEGRVARESISFRVR